MPTTSVADGVIPHGSFDITILETGQAYVADNFNFDVDAKLLRSNNSVGNPSRQKVIKGFVDGNCDLQLADETTLAPDVGHHFEADADKDGTAEPYMIVKPGRTFTADDIFKCKASITRCVNPVIKTDTASGKTIPQLLAGVTYASTVAITAIDFGAMLPPGETLTSVVWTSTALPPGLTLNSSTGAISGTPTTPASALSVTVTLTLANGKKAQFTFSITIT
jgi:hypothetical protein